ncbi:MAG: Septum formation protein Maf [Burkholderiaceae bacterium]|nr:Septum formation protein Maf [Burkholderiaceae bacterium]
MNKTEQTIYLASQSPRRRELLRQIGVKFQLLLLRSTPPRGADVSEEVLPGEAPHDYVTRVTREKVMFAQDVLTMRSLPPRPILAADTTVVLDGKILGKPANATEATEMLQSLSGRTHEVITGIAVAHQARLSQVLQISEVTFAPLSQETIAAYCASGEPYDKAGGYGIQGMAATFIARIDGSYSGIMGLPLFETAHLLRQAGIHTI